MYVWVARMAKAVTNGKRYRNPHDICDVCIKKKCMKVRRYS